MTETLRQRRPEILIAPGIVLTSVIGLLLAARFYEKLPVKPDDCVFPERFGIPCPGCGGTRAMQALSHGEVATALAFHPAAVLGVFIAAAWFVSRFFQFRAGANPPTIEEQRATLARGVGIAALLIAANWIYLIAFPP